MLPNRLHIPATRATRHFINDERLAAMKPGVILINTAAAPHRHRRPEVPGFQRRLNAAAVVSFV